MSILSQASGPQLSVTNQNTAGLLLYKKFGFEPFDIEERVAPNGKQVALIHMRHQAVKTQPVDVTDSQSAGNFDRIEIA
jgi:hypothetical protein